MDKLSKNEKSKRIKRWEPGRLFESLKSDDDYLLTQEQYYTFNEEQLIEKPVDDNDNSNEIENVSAPANFAPKPENTNTQELPCPKNSFTVTPMGLY